MTQKDVEITTTAVLKSVIESGAPKEQWEELVKHGVCVYVKISNSWKEQLNGK